MLTRADDDEATQRIVITDLLLATTAYVVELERRHRLRTSPDQSANQDD